MEKTQFPSPERLFRIVNGYQAGRALEAAIRLDLFSSLGDQSLTSSELAQRIGASERGTRILCDYLTILECLRKEGSSYRQTDESALFLDRSSKAYTGSIVEFLLSPQMVAAFDDLDQAVRKGGTIMGEEGTMEPEHPVWISFARSMGPLVAPAARFIAEIADLPTDQPLRVLDIAAGHGLFGISTAQRYPKAEVYAVDWPAVLEVAEGNAQEAGIGDRYHTIPGSAFEVEYGENYDLVLATNFFHHFDPPTCQGLMKRMEAALLPSGKLITLEFVPNEDRITPLHAASFPLIMLATTARGDAYTFAEYDRMFRSVALAKNEPFQVPRSPHQVIVSTH